MIVLLVIPKTAMADNYFAPEYNATAFLVTPKAPGIVHIKCAYMEQHTSVLVPNGYIQKNASGGFPDGGYVEFKATSGTTSRIFTIYYENNENDTKDYAFVHVRSWVDGVLLITNAYNTNDPYYTYNGVKYKGMYVTKEDRVYKVKKIKGENGACCVEFDWYYPAPFCSNSGIFQISAYCKNSSINLNKREFAGSPIAMSDTPKLTVSDPVFSPVGENMGYYNLLLSNDTGAKVIINKAEELNEDGQPIKDITNECKSSSNGISILIPAVNYTRKVRVQSQTPLSEYVYFALPDKVVTLKAFHNPKDFELKAENTTKGFTKLSWKVPYPNDEDVLPTDALIIERKADGVDSVWVRKDQLMMEKGKADYEYIDSLSGCMGDTIHHTIHYRLSRATTGSVKEYMDSTTIHKNVTWGTVDELSTTLSFDEKKKKVDIIWRVKTDPNDVNCFWPEKMRAVVKRTGSYKKKGVEQTESQLFDVVPDKSDPENIWFYFTDQSLSGCTSYSYAIYLLPQHASMKDYEYKFPDVVKLDESLMVNNFQASQEQFQDHVHLQWQCDASRFDEIKLERRSGTSGWEKLNINETMPYYDDYTVKPGEKYDYQLTATYDCNGQKTFTAQASGASRPSGRIAGFVTFSDGTGVPDVMIRLTQEQNGTVVSLDTCYTTQSGSYLFPDVKFSNDPYILVLESSYSTFDRVNIPVRLDATQTTQYDKNFICTGSFSFEGHVYYTQSTVPVVGASFEVDGKPVYDKSGALVLSDNDGHFDFNVLRGARRVVVKKDGHTFKYNGLFADNNGNAREITEPFANVFFWDDTKVRLVGRVVGGLDQGEKPLMQALSKNNLGDDLRIVLEPEGNLRAWLVKDQTDDNLRERKDTIRHTMVTEPTYNTVLTERRRVVITPNSQSGEFAADLLPMRYKIVEISAKGYSTLFQKGSVSEVLDLSDSLTVKKLTSEDGNKSMDYQAIYNRIYRREPSIAMIERDAEGNDLSCYGLASYPIVLGQQTIDAPLYNAETKTYTFGYPVMGVGDHYFHIKATENYYYNNEMTGACDSVPLRSGKVKVYDDFAAEQSSDIYELNKENGSVDINVDVANFTFDVSGENALRHLDVTLEYDGAFIDGQSLRAYVLGNETQADDFISTDGKIMVEGVLRDPPGSKSYAWIDKGTTYNNNFDVGFDASLALALAFETGSGGNYHMGSFAGQGGGTYMGSSSSTKTTTKIGPVNIPIVGGGYHYKGTTVFELNERLQTSADPAHVGAGADLYYGYELGIATNVVKNVRVIDRVTYEHMKAQGIFDAATGSARLIAEGSINGMEYNLISDYAYVYSPKVKSHFYYTQDYIVNTLIPKLKQMRNSYIFKGSLEQAKAKATETGRYVFFSHRAETDERFCMENVDDTLGYISIDRYDEFRQRDMLNYEIVTPMYVNYLGLEKQLAAAAQVNDSIHMINKKIAQWEYAIGNYEYEKVAAFQAVDNHAAARDSLGYDNGTPYGVKSDDYYVENHHLVGGIQLSHSEFFQTSGGKHKPSFSLGGLDLVKAINGGGGLDKWFENIVNGAITTGVNTANNKLDGYGTPINRDSLGFITVTSPAGGAVNYNYKDLKDLSKLGNIADKMKNENATIVDAGGAYMKMTVSPVIDAHFTYERDEDTSSKTTRGYVLETDPDSHLDIDVYHDVKATETGRDGSVTNFSNGNYIYRIMGGATKCPYEGGEKTIYYKPGTEVSRPTAQVEKPRISVENHVISGVPYGEKARFNLVLSNEGSLRAEGTFDLILQDASNQRGLTLIMDGAPLGNGRSLVVPYGTGLVKVLEVGCGTDYDYEDLKLILRSQCDTKVADTLSLSIHFTPSSSPITVVSPANKWVLNTNSAADSQGRYYMPINITGFDVNYRNFDHIELQYKQSNESETRWTNLCSYYANDSLYQKGTGTRAMINGSSITHAFYGDSDPVELKYDLRAVTYSRLGSGYVTNSSPVFSGIKDTRRPQIFGRPQPANNVLGINDELKLVFSEPIDANKLLAANNFKVTGLPNNSEVNTSTSIRFNSDGTTLSYLESEAERNFNNGSFAIDLLIKPDFTNGVDSMTLFRQVTSDGNTLKFVIRKNHQLRAIFDNSNGQTTLYTSKTDDKVNWNLFQRVVLTYDDNTQQVHFYVGGANMDSDNDKNRTFSGHSGSGKIVFGSDYNGNMAEARIWTKYLDIEQLNATSNTLCGYEVNLCDYYPMNEGKDNEVEDKAQGATLTMVNANWNVPEGRALRVEGNPNVKIKESLFERITASKSYTLSFWFNADTSNDTQFTLLSSPYSENLTDRLAFSVLDGTLCLQDLKQQTDTTLLKANGNFLDGKWHQVTLVVDKVANLTTLYVDGDLSAQCATEGLPSWSGNLLIGVAERYSTEQSAVVQVNQMKGYFDEFTLWDMATPQNIVWQRMNESCDGSEQGLLAYIPFSEQVQQQSGGGTLMEFSDKSFTNRWDTDEKKYVKVKEEAFVDATAITEAMKSSGVFAPMKEKSKWKDLRFNFITKDNELLIELTEPAKDIERTIVNISAMGIEDLNGNEMEQPVIWSAFVHRNMVRWGETKKRIEIDAEDNKDHTFTVDVRNQSGSYHDYIIEGMPSWITIEPGTKGSLDPEEAVTLNITISKDVNIGTYDEVLYLKNDEGLVDPLILTIVKSGKAPNWTFDKNKQRSMQVCAQVMLGNTVVSDKNDLIGVFDENDRCLGTGNIITNQQGKPMLYLTVYGQSDTKSLIFRLWHYRNGITYRLEPSRPIIYEPETVYGNYEDPVILTATLFITQDISLKPIWTWVSMNVKSGDFGDMNTLLKKGKWSDGDQLKDPESQMFYNYSRGVWKASSTAENLLSCKRMYYIKSRNEQTFQIDGAPISEEEERRISIRNGWNYIGYTPIVNLPVNEALSDFYSKASDGDIIKSQEEFATFSKAAGWQGNLRYMKPGQGYMLRHAAAKPDEETSFVYPFKNYGSVSQVAEEQQPTAAASYQHTMNMIVQTEGVEAAEGDRLFVYTDNELCGEATAEQIDDKTVFFLSIGGESAAPLSFVLERDGDMLGVSQRSATYHADTLEGSIDVPCTITFNNFEGYEDGEWYTISGQHLTRRPTQRGIYIRNHQKLIIR